MATGLGGEQLWLSPTVANNVNPYDDQSGQGNNGTGLGGMSTVSDVSNGGTFAYDFSGSAGKGVSVPSFDVTSSPMEVSIAFWSKLNTIVSPGTSHFVQRSYLSGKEPYVVKYTSPTNFTVRCTNGFTTVGNDLTSPFSTGQWYHTVAQYDNTAGTWETFIDGVSAGSTAGTNEITNNGGNVTIGAGTTANGSPKQGIDGYMDDVRIFDRPLTQAEITHLATSRGVLGPPGGATHYNPFKTHAFTNNFQQRLR